MTCTRFLALAALAAASIGAPAMAADRPAGWGEAATSITRMLETARPADPAAYATISGDGDGQGLSVGTMQWNIGQGTIADLLARMPTADAVAAARMPTFGAVFLINARASATPFGRSTALAWARSWQTGKTIDPVLKAELQAFLADPAAIAAQDSFEEDYRSEAWTLASGWAQNVEGRPAPNFGEFATFYDLRVQGGSGYLDDLEQLLERYALIFKADRAGAFSVKAVAAAGFVSLKDGQSCAVPTTPRTRATGHVWDARANCGIWRRLIARDQLPDAQRELLVLAFLRSFLARDEFAVNFYNRKGLLAAGRGVANGWSCDFRPVYARLDGGGTTSPDEIKASCHAPLPAPSPAAPAPLATPAAAPK